MSMLPLLAYQGSKANLNQCGMFLGIHFCQIDFVRQTYDKHKTAQKHSRLNGFALFHTIAHRYWSSILTANKAEYKIVLKCNYMAVLCVN